MSPGEGCRARGIGGRPFGCGEDAMGFRARPAGFASCARAGSGCAYALLSMLLACEAGTFCGVGNTSLRYFTSAGLIRCGGGGGGGAFLLVAGGGDGKRFSGSDLKSGADELPDGLAASKGGLASYDT